MIIDCQVHYHPCLTPKRHNHKSSEIVAPSGWEQTGGSSYQRQRDLRNQGGAQGRFGRGHQSKYGGGRQHGRGSNQGRNNGNQTSFFHAGTHPQIRVLMAPYAQTAGRFNIRKFKANTGFGREKFLPFFTDQGMGKRVCTLNIFTALPLSRFWRQFEARLRRKFYSKTTS